MIHGLADDPLHSLRCRAFGIAQVDLVAVEGGGKLAEVTFRVLDKTQVLHQMRLSREGPPGSASSALPNQTERSQRGLVWNRSGEGEERLFYPFVVVRAFARQSFRRLLVAHSSFHSASHAASPRRMNRRAPLVHLISPNTGSQIWGRWA